MPNPPETSEAAPDLPGLPPAPAWSPADALDVGPTSPLADPHVTVLAAIWTRRGASPAPAQCDVCGAPERELANGRTEIVHDEAKHAALYAKTQEQLEPTRPRRVADDDADPIPSSRQPALARVRRAFGDD